MTEDVRIFETDTLVPNAESNTEQGWGRGPISYIRRVKWSYDVRTSSDR